MGLLLLLKLSPRTARLGIPSMAFLVGVGAAVAIGGAIMGTLFPQTWASMQAFNLSVPENTGWKRVMKGLSCWSVP